MVGMVVTISPNFNLYRMVVFPAASCMFKAHQLRDTSPAIFHGPILISPSHNANNRCSSRAAADGNSGRDGVQDKKPGTVPMRKDGSV